MKNLFFVLFSIIFLLFSCAKDDNDIPETADYKFDVNAVGESSVEIKWDENIESPSINFKVDTSEFFTSPIVDVDIESTENNVSIFGLTALTDYYLQIEIKDGNEVIFLEIHEFKSSYTAEEVSYPSTNEVYVSATVGYIESKLSESSKKIIFLHGAGQRRSVWMQTDIATELIKDGNLCIFIDFRGHGRTGYSGETLTLLERPWEFREDFDATVGFLDTINLPCSDDIIVMGESLGASVAAAVSTYDKVIGGVASSTPKSISIALFEGTIAPKGMFYLAGELDKNEYRGIDYLEDANYFYDITSGQRQVEIVLDSDLHGVELILSDESLVQKVVEWVRGL
jgi:dienelactone hydrolase